MSIGVHFPIGIYLLCGGYLWLSLSWCGELRLRNIQDAMQISMPLVVGVAASLFVRSEFQLDRLLRVFGLLLMMLVLIPVAERMGVLGTLGMSMTPRPLALTAALVACVFMARIPTRLVGPLVVWAICIGLTVASGGRTGTLVLLLIPVLHPLYRTRLVNGAVVAFTAGLGVVLFYLPVFQERFFYEGSGTLTDVFQGDFLTFGRFEAWPDIWDEAWRRPYFGAGVGSVYDFVPTVWEGMHQAHNDYLRIGFELGLVGLGIFVCVMLWQLWNLRTQLRASEGIIRTAFAAAWLGLLVFLITGTTDNTLSYNLAYMNPLFAVLGAAYGVAGRKRSDEARGNRMMLWQGSRNRRSLRFNERVVVG